jgi:hypothetical protein
MLHCFLAEQNSPVPIALEDFNNKLIILILTVSNALEDFSL